MVRLKREIEGLKRDPEKCLPVYLEDEERRERLDTLFRGRIEEVSWEEGGRVLLVCPPLSLARRILELASHVTIVEPDSRRTADLLEGLSSISDVRTLTLHAREYAEISFERSAFDLTISFDDLNGYFSPGNALRKYGRELKVSGVFIGRVAFARAEEIENTPGRWEVSQLEFEKESKGGFRIDSIERLAATGIFLDEVSKRMPRMPRWILKKAWSAALRVDASLSPEALAGLPAVSIVLGGKGLTFGSVFQLNSESEDA